jgi:hypothetical protein
MRDFDMKDYKQAQRETRVKLKHRRLLYFAPPTSQPLNLGIRKFKRTGVSPEYIKIFKENAWGSIGRPEHA